jgi:hypothetical protein
METLKRQQRRQWVAIVHKGTNQILPVSKIYKKTKQINGNTNKLKLG